MARKKEIEQALHGYAYAPSAEEREERYARELAEHTARAKQYLAEQGLSRRDDEPFEDWTLRLRHWMREKAAFKRFGSAS